jgi:hypothetical protein
MAGRDGALTIYHFEGTIEGLKNSLTNCPSLNNQVDRQKLKTER